MKILKTILLFAIVQGSVISCHGQTVTLDEVGGPCEGCEAIYEFKDKVLQASDTLPGFMSHEPKMVISGTVYRKDGKTPASDVIIYIYHANRSGVYELKGNESGWAKRHGYNRGWVKTGKDGKYTFYTFRPGAYPDGTEPEHIHITIKEPKLKEYYLDEFFFKDDPQLTMDFINKQPKRGGSGIVIPQNREGRLYVHRDIILGMNIPNYK